MTVPTDERDYSLEVLDCRYGRLLAFRSDEVISRSLRVYGEWAEHELGYLRQYVIPGETVIDVGAHLGTHTLAFARWIGAGHVIAIEAQAAVAAVLWSNCLLNERRNVQVINAICADVGKTDYDIVERSDDGRNLGAVSMRPDRSRFVALLRRLAARQPRWKPRVPGICLADFHREKVSLVKIDVEAMELEVLRGGIALLKAARPVIFMEQNDTRQLSGIRNLLAPLGYQLYWLETQPFNRANFRNAAENIWWRTETGILALPDRRSPPDGVTPVTGDEVAVPVRLNAREGATVTVPG